MKQGRRGRMIRASFITVALAVTALSSGAQNPTPEPTPAPPPPPSTEVIPVKPTPAPRAKRPAAPPKIWQSGDLMDLEYRLDALKDLDFDLVTPAMPPLPPQPMFDLDLDFAPAALALDRVRDAMPDMDFDFEMPDMPDMPDWPDMPDMPDVDF